MPSVAQNRYGPVWPLGFIAVAAPGTPVCINKLVSPSGEHTSSDPNTTQADRAQQLIFQAVKPGVAHGTQPNAGNIYLVMKGGSRDDTGLILITITPGQTFFLSSAPLNVNVLGLEWFYVDSDNAGDGAFVTAVIQ